MPSIPHVLRRGAVYAFRRRTGPGGAVVQVSLRTADPVVARRLSPLAAAAFDAALEGVRRGMLTTAEVRVLLEHVVREHSAKLARLRQADLLSEDGPEAARRDDLLAAAAMRLLAERGPGATAAALGEHGWRDADLAPEDAKALEDQIEFHRAQYWNSGRDYRLEVLLAEAIGRGSNGPAEVEHARRIVLRGHAAACRESARLRGTEVVDVAALAERLAREIREAPITAPRAEPAAPTASAAPMASAAPTASAASAPPAPQPVEAAPEVEAPEVDDRLSTLRELMAAETARNGLSQRTVDQIRQTLALFEDSTGVARARDIRQAHLATFVDVMDRLPRSYRKSAADRDLPLKEILARTERDPSAKVGLAGATVNRNLHFVARFLEFAEARGCVVDPKLTTRRLRRRRKVRARDERKAFTRAQLAKVVAQPPWQGCRSEKRRRAPGDLIVLDGRHWVPLIAAHSGMRREEAAALKVDEVTTEDGVPVFKLRMTAERPLKNASSERVVPIHPALIRHGLLEHVEAMRAAGATDAFPELRPSGRGRALYGDGIDEFWRNTVRDALGAEAEELEFHSLRRYVSDELRDHADLPKAARSDVLGHTEADETDGRYGSDSRVARKLEAIRRLPDLLSLAAAQGGAERPERRRVRPLPTPPAPPATVTKPAAPRPRTSGGHGSGAKARRRAASAPRR